MTVAFSHRLPEPALREWQALESERDSSLYWEAVYHFARRRESEGDLQIAADLYSAIGAEEGRSAPSSELRRQARERLETILGRGALGQRAEFLLRNLTRQATDPTMIFAMGAAGAVFRLTRLATLTRLSASASPGFFSQLMGAGRLASLAGFALEAPAFTLALRLGGEVLGGPQDWGSSALGRDLASSFLTLGGLKLAGWASGSAYRTWAGGNRPAGSALESLFQQGGMLSGIWLGHAAEERLGLRPRSDAASSLADSLALLLQFHVAGRLTRQAFGPTWAAWETSLDLRAESLSHFRLPGGPDAAVSPLNPRQIVFASTSEETEQAALPTTVMMTQGGGEGNGDGGKGKPVRTFTLPGLGRRSSLPQEPTRPEAPLASEIALPAIFGLSPRARYLRVEGLKIPTPDPTARLAEALDLYFQHYREPVVVTLPTAELTNPRTQGIFRVDLHRLFREHHLPEYLTVTVHLPTEGVALHFRKQGLSFQVDQVEVVSRASRSSVPARPPTIPDLGVSRGSIATDQPVAMAKQAFRANLRTLDSSSILSPAIRMPEGRLEEKDLQEFADVLSEHPLPEARKITVLWMERGGGNVSFQRMGDLIRAERKAYQESHQAYWLIPSEARFAHLGVFREEQLPSYPYENPRRYQNGVEQELVRLHGRLGHPVKFESLAGREEGAARRGEILVKLISYWLRENGSSGKTLTPNAQEDFIAAHRLLEKAYTFLDLGVARAFSERLGTQRLKQYREVLESMNRLRGNSGQSLLLPIEEFPVDLAGDYAIPIGDSLRGAFTDLLFKDRGGVRIPMENNGLRRSPDRLGVIFRETVRGRALPLLAAIRMIQQNGAGETLETLMAPGRRDLNDYHEKMRGDLTFFLREWSEVGRILRGRPGAFHRTFLGEIFLGSRSVKGLYSQALEGIRALPPELRRTQGLDDLPALSEIETTLRGSRP